MFARGLKGLLLVRSTVLPAGAPRLGTLPKQARYQLRYTSIDILFLPCRKSLQINQSLIHDKEFYHKYIFLSREMLKHRRNKSLHIYVKFTDITIFLLSKGIEVATILWYIFILSSVFSLNANIVEKITCHNMRNFVDKCRLRLTACSRYSKVGVHCRWRQKTLIF